MKRISLMFLTNEERASLGSVAAESAYLEALVDDAIKDVAKLTSAQYEIFASRLMLGSKLDMLLALGELHLRSNRRKLKFRSIISALKALNSERVLAVHGLWEPIYEEAPAHVVGIIARAMAAKRIGAKARNSRTQVLSPLSSDRLDKLAQSIHESSQALYNFTSDVWTRRANIKKIARALFKSRKNF